MHITIVYSIRRVRITDAAVLRLYVVVEINRQLIILYFSATLYQKAPAV